MRICTLKLFFVTLLLLIGSRVSAQDVLSNQDIIKMSQSKLSNRLIMDKIQASRTQFDLSVSGLKNLVTTGISDQILETMLQVTKQTDVLTNEDVIELYRAKLSNRLLKQKIMASSGKYDTSTDALIRLKNAKVPDAIVKLLMTSPSDTSPKVQGANSVVSTEVKKDKKRPDYCKTWFDKFTKTNITASRATLRGRKVSNVLLGRSTSTLAGIEDLEVDLIFSRDGNALSLGLYASKPGVHELYVDKNKPLMFLLDDGSRMDFYPTQESESDLSFHLFTNNVDSKLLIYYSLTQEQLQTLTRKRIKEYRMNTFNRHSNEDTVNPGRAEQVQAAAKCILES